MKKIITIMGALFLVAIAAAHFLLLSLFFIPLPKALSLIIKEKEFISESDIPDNVRDFLKANNLSVLANYQPDSVKSDFILNLLKARSRKFMTYEEQLAFNMNLLDFKDGTIGMRQASERYLKKPLSELPGKEWITLINLYKILSIK